MSETQTEYDAFVSYNRTDKKDVNKIFRWFNLNTDLKLWFDARMIPGKKWRNEIAKGLSRSKSCLVFIGRDGVGSWQSDEIEIALDLSKTKDDFKIIPIILPGGSETSIPAWLRDKGWLEVKKRGDQDFLAMVKLSFTILGRSFTGNSIVLENQQPGAVLFANITNYPKLKPYYKKKSIDWIINEIEGLALNIEIRWVNLQEGEFLVFIERGERNEKTIMSLVFAFGLILQIRCEKQKYNIGVSIHWEGNSTWKSIVHDSFLIGNSLNEAKRFMAFSVENHYFLSKKAFKTLEFEKEGSVGEIVNDLINDINEITGDDEKIIDDLWPELSTKSGIFSIKNRMFMFQSFIYYDRYKQENELINFHISSDLEVGVEMQPYQSVQIEYRDERSNDPTQKFVERLEKADKITLLGLTHKGTQGFLEKALSVREKKGKGFWQHLRIIFPTKRSVQSIIEEKITSEERLVDWLSGRTEVYKFLLGRGSAHREKWECLEYDGILPFGGDKCKINGRESFRAQFIMPGVDMQEVFYLEVFEKTKAFNQLSKTLDVVIGNCHRFIEWTIYGSFKNKSFSLIGLMNRKDLSANAKLNPNKYCFPVVLIMLYKISKSGNKSILQFRNIYNSTSDPNTYSNISGRLIDRDVFNAHEMEVPQQYINDYYSYDFTLSENAEDTISEAFKSMTDVYKEIPESTWVETAVREVEEELGLKIDPNRLNFEKDYHLDRPDRPYTLLFRIFSLALDNIGPDNEITQIKKLRKYADLHEFSLSDIIALYKRRELNALLQRKFKEVFCPIFKKLNIAE